jgi:hypothetical protein
MASRTSTPFIEKRRYYVGHDHVIRYIDRGPTHYSTEDVIDRPIVRTSTVVYLTFITLVIAFVIWQGLLVLPQ